MTFLSAGICLVALYGVTDRLIADSAVMYATKTNTLIQVTSGTAQQLSNGQGDIFVGRTNQDFNDSPTISIRRGLIEFNPAAIMPVGATITDVTLTAEQLSSGTWSETVSLSPMLRDWGQGSSLANGGGGAAATNGDATWYYPFYGQPATWTAPGGKPGFDYSAGTSAAALVSGSAVQTFTWSSSANPALLSDVQQWLDNPAANFGWILLGDESTGRTTKSFAGQHAVSPSTPPQLTVQYVAPWTWSGGGGNNSWTTADNWTNGGRVPPSGAAIMLGDSHSTSGTVDLDSASPNISHLSFGDNRIMTITDSVAGGGHLTLDNGTNPIAVVVSGSGHAIGTQVAVTLNSDLWITTIGSGDSLQIAGNIANGTGAHGLLKLGDGTLVLSGSNTNTGETVVSDGTLVVASPHSFADDASLSIGGNAWLFGSESPTLPVEQLPIAASAVPEPEGRALLVSSILLAALIARFTKARQRILARYRS
jgi:autotransporter-associated beta strand protein